MNLWNYHPVICSYWNCTVDMEIKAFKCNLQVAQNVQCLFGNYFITVYYSYMYVYVIYLQDDILLPSYLVDSS